MGARRLAALINGLPLDSALVRSYDPDRLGRGWDLQTEMLAIVAELIDRHDRHFLMANTKRGTTIPKPLYIARPDDAKRGRSATPKTDPAALKRFAAQRGIPIVKKKKD